MPACPDRSPLRRTRAKSAKMRPAPRPQPPEKAKRFEAWFSTVSFLFPASRSLSLSKGRRPFLCNFRVSAYRKETVLSMLVRLLTSSAPAFSSRLLLRKSDAAPLLAVILSHLRSFSQGDPAAPPASNICIFAPFALLRWKFFILFCAYCLFLLGNSVVFSLFWGVSTIA